VAQILINVIGVLLFLPFLAPFTELVSRTSHDLARQIANAHTIFNVTVSVVLFPFVRQITRLVEWLVPEGRTAAKPSLTAHIDDRLLHIPQVAIREASHELSHLGDVTAEMLEQSCCALLDQDMETAQWVLDQERAFVDPVSKTLEKYVNGLLQTNLSAEQQQRCLQIKSLTTDVERIGDLTENLAEAAQQRVQHGIVFSPTAEEELGRLCQHAHRTYTCALDALRDRDRSMAEEACLLESEFDGLYLEARQAHIERLEAGVCQPEADVLFMESLRNLERICDHADNVGVSVQHS
jgi:phosphate:Na+ symporter